MALLPILPIIYRDDQVSVEISNSRIVCRARNLGRDEGLRRSGEIAATILEALPETPVKGIGVNFGFRETLPDANLLNLFNWADNALWAENEWEMQERKIVRQLTRNGYTLNLTLTLNNGVLDIDFNFHSAPDGNAAAIEAVAPDRVIQLRDTAMTTMESIYNLFLEANDGDT